MMSGYSLRQAYGRHLAAGCRSSRTSTVSQRLQPPISPGSLELSWAVVHPAHAETFDRLVAQGRPSPRAALALAPTRCPTGRTGRLSISLADVTGHAMEAAVPVLMFSGILDNQMEAPKPLADLFASLN